MALVLSFLFETTTINVFTNKSSAVSLFLTETLLREHLIAVQDNTKTFVTGMWDNLIIDFWDPTLSDCPSSSLGVQMGIKEYAGLTWAAERKIQINTNYASTPSALANCLSHELGHWFNSVVKIGAELDNLWEKLRGGYVTPATPKAELFAEDFRLLFGSKGAKGVYRTDSYNYIQASTVTGCEEFYKIIPKAQTYINTLKHTGSTIENIYYDRSAKCIIFTSKSANIFSPVTTSFKIDITGIYAKQSFLVFSWYSKVV